MTSGERGAGVGARSAARIAAVQGLYQMDLVQTDVSAVIDEFQQIRFPQAEAGDAVDGADPTFFGELLRGVVRRQRDIDPLVDRLLAAGWRLGRVDSILRAILRSAVFELMERPDVPAKVVINEYIEIAHAFFSEEEPKVVNGILDKVARQFRPAEFAKKPGGPLS